MITTAWSEDRGNVINTGELASGARVGYLSTGFIPRMFIDGLQLNFGNNGRPVTNHHRHMWALSLGNTGSVGRALLERTRDEFLQWRIEHEG